MNTIGYYLAVDYEGTVGDPIVFYDEQIDKYIDKGTDFYKMLKEVDLMERLKDNEHFVEERKLTTRGFEIDLCFRHNIANAIVYDLDDDVINKYLEEIGIEKAKDIVDGEKWGSRGLDLDTDKGKRRLLETVICWMFGINKNYTEVFAQAFNRIDCEDEDYEI